MEGGTEITFTGENLVTDPSLIKVIIDGIVCPVSAASTTSITCVSGKRPGLVSTSLQIYIEGRGLISNRGIVFRYVNMWSADSTWGGEFAPLEGESVYIPAGLNLLVDIDQTPVLNAVLVEGGLVFAPDEDNENN